MSENSFHSISDSLLLRVQCRDEVAWQRMILLFTPPVYGWVRAAGLAEHDARDVVQDVFLGVFQNAKGFNRDRPGATFRGWLRRITQYKIADFRRKQNNRPIAIGGSDAHIWFNGQEDSCDEEDCRESGFEGGVVRRCIELLHDEFEPKTWLAFEAIAVEGLSAGEVSAKLGMSVGAVYVAKSRVLKRLREELAGLLECEENTLVKETNDN